MVAPIPNNQEIVLRSVLPKPSEKLTEQLKQSEEEIAHIRDLLKETKTLARKTTLRIAQARKGWLDICRLSDGQFSAFNGEFRLGKSRKTYTFRHDGHHWYADSKDNLPWLRNDDLFDLVKSAFMRLYL